MMMQVRSEKDKSQISSHDSSFYMTRSVRLGAYRKAKHSSTTTSCQRFSFSVQKSMLDSISRKLKPSHIVLYSKKPSLSEPICQYQQKDIISCMPVVASLPLKHKRGMQYNDLLQKKNKQGCLSDNRTVLNADKMVQSCACEVNGYVGQQCGIRRRWVRQILFYEKEVKNVYLLKQKINSCSKQSLSQIEKDVLRTFSSHLSARSKLNIVKKVNQKINLTDCLKWVLRMYAAHDSKVGYVQGMNLVAASIILHIKQATPSFIVFKELMNYGKLRSFYIDDFNMIRREIDSFTGRQINYTNKELRQLMDQQMIDSGLLMPFYITLFANVVDIHLMYLVIDEFMRQGTPFLHKAMLTLLLYLKHQMQLRHLQGLRCMLGASFIKSLSVNWLQFFKCVSQVDLL